MVKKAELLADKVKDAPTSDRDIDPAFEMFIKPRLEKIPESFTSELEHRRAKNLGTGKTTNAERWQKTE